MLKDLVIVGSGMVGSSLACALAKSQMVSSIAVIDRSAFPSAPTSDIPDPRVVTLTPTSQQFLKSIDSWELIEPRRRPEFNQMKVWDDFGTGFMHFEEAKGWVVENSALVYANVKRLKDFEAVELITGANIKRIQPGGADVTIELEDGRAISTPLVIGAEGKDSSVRRAFGIGTWNWSYPHNGLTCVVKVEKPNGQAHQRFLKTGPIALLPLWDDYVSVVWSLPPDLTQRMQTIPDDQFIEELNRAVSLPSSEAFPVSDHISSIKPVVSQSLATKRFVFPYALQHARQYVAPRVALVGDSAHTLHPMAGQGFNIGLYDSINLAYELCKAAELGKDFGSIEVLERYQLRSRSYNISLTALEQALLVLYGDYWPLNYLRNVGMSAISSLPPLKSLILSGANGSLFVPTDLPWDK